jgi:hypothetical protein
MRPDVFVRRGGRGAASACFDTGADDGAAATCFAGAVVAGAVVAGVDDCVAEAAAVVGADFGGSALATTDFSTVLGGATFTGVDGFDGVVALAGAVVAVSTFVGALATASAFTGAVTLVDPAEAGDGCDGADCDWLFGWGWVVLGCVAFAWLVCG